MGEGVGEMVRRREGEEACLFACAARWRWGRATETAYNDGVACVRVTEYGSMLALEHAEGRRQMWKQQTWCRGKLIS